MRRWLLLMWGLLSLLMAACLLPTVPQFGGTPPTEVTLWTPEPIVAGMAEVTPASATIMAGDTAQYRIGVLDGWEESLGMPAWEAMGPLPAVPVIFATGGGHPADGVMLVSIPADTPAGNYPVAISAYAGSHRWDAIVDLVVLTCAERLPAGQTTYTMRDFGASYLPMGASSLTWGIAVPLHFCASTPRQLQITVETATTDDRTPISQPAAQLVILRLLNPPGLEGVSSDWNTVASSETGTLTWDIVPGGYTLFIPQDQFVREPQAGAIRLGVSVTLQLAVTGGG